MTMLKSAVAVIAALGTFELAATATPLGMVQSAQAQDLSSSFQFKVKKLATQINKLRKSLASQGAAAVADDFKAKQLQGRIDSFKSGLAKYPANTDPAFQAAQAELAALEQEFAALKSGGAATPAPAAPAQPAQQQTTPAPAAPAAAPAAAQLDSSAAIKLSALIGNMQRTRKMVETRGAQDMQTAAGVEKYKKDIGEYANALKQYVPFKTDPRVLAAVEEYKTLRASMSDAFQASKTMKTGNDAVQAELASISAALSGNTAPKVLHAPFEEAEAKAWIDRTRAVIATAEKAMAELNDIGGKHPLPLTDGAVSQGAAYDKQDLQSMFGLAQNQIRYTKETIQQTELNFGAGLSDGSNGHSMDFYRKLDPDNSNQKANLFLAEGAELQQYSQIDALIALGRSYAVYERLSKGKVSPQTQANLDEAIGFRKAYAEGRMKAVGDSKMPEPKSTDADMLAVAKDIIERPKYEFGEHGPIVLTTPEIVTREKKVSRDTIKDVDVSLSGDITWSGTRETWDYKWDEFRFATPLKDDNGDWYIWWVKAKNFKSGASSTPLNQWVSGEATKGSLILEENFR